MRLIRILPYVGTFLKVNAVVLMLPALVAYFYHESVTPYLVAAFFSYVAGFLVSRRKHDELVYGDSMILSAMTLVLISFFGSIPFILQLPGGFAEVVVDSYFESSSGYTTTGLSILRDIARAPRSLIFLRALMQWIGGIGIVVLSLSAIMHGVSSYYLYREEHDPNRLLPSVKKSAGMIVKIYVFYTFAGVALLWLTGTDLFSAVCSIFSAVSTGGFAFGTSTYANAAGKHLLTLFMLLGSVGFILHFRLFTGKWREVLATTEVKVMAVILAASLTAYTILFMNLGGAAVPSVQAALFNGVSAITTTGYSDVDFASLPDFGKIYTTLLMIMGGGVGSTAGGVKLFRVFILASALVWFVRKTTLPEHAVVPFKVGGKVIEEAELISVAVFFFLYLAVAALGGFILTAYNYPPVDSLFLSASAVGTVGLSTLEVAPLPLPAKCVLILEMLLGRVEIVSMIALIGYVAEGLLRGKVV